MHGLSAFRRTIVYLEQRTRHQRCKEVRFWLRDSERATCMGCRPLDVPPRTWSKEETTPEMQRDRFPASLSARQWNTNYTHGLSAFRRRPPPRTCTKRTRCHLHNSPPPLVLLNVLGCRVHILGTICNPGTETTMKVFISISMVLLRFPNFPQPPPTHSESQSVQLQVTTFSSTYWTFC